MWTAHHWQHWLARGDFPDHRWRSYLARSALTLKGLTFAPTGAIAAAATTSLPETPGGERNWDYRYSWIRDATFALWGLFTLGFEWEASDYFAFLTDVVERDRGDMQIVYGIDGRSELPEQTLKHLHGYQGAQPVRIGNDAYAQQQNDVWGVVLDSLYLHTRSRDRLDERVWQMARHQVEHALEHWREPDRGIWEVRGAPRHFTSSKLMCWVAADRGARLARIKEDPDAARRWQQAANEIHADICANAVDDRGVFCQHYETTALDASLLLMPMLRFLPPDDPRIRATVLAIADELTQDGLVLRYRVEETDDGLSGREGTFTICSFWLVSALAEIGEHRRARDLCEKVLSYASPLLLYAEEIEATSGRHLGNFPQAFTHLALINAVMHVIEHDEEEARFPGDGRAATGSGNGKLRRRDRIDSEPLRRQRPDPAELARSVAGDGRGARASGRDQVRRRELDLQPALARAAEHGGVRRARVSSTTTGSRLRSPIGAMPPVTYPDDFSACTGSAMTALLPPTAAASAFRSRLPATGTTPTVSWPSTSAIEGLEDPFGRHAKRLARLLPVRGVPRVVLVAVDGVADAQLGEQFGRPGAAPASHVASLTGRPRD